MSKFGTALMQNALFTGENRERYRRILRMERWVLHGPRGQFDSIACGEDWKRYQDEFEAIAKELNPAFLEGKRKQVENRARLDAEYERHRLERERLLRDAWPSITGVNA